MVIIPVYDEIKTLVRTSGFPLAYISRQTHVHTRTLRAWISNQTYAPRIDTMLRVAQFLGDHNIELTENVKKLVGFYPPPKQRFGVTKYLNWRM